MMTSTGGSSFLLLLLLLVCACGKHYVPCPLQEGEEKRELYVATCDTRAGWKEFNALKVWNITGTELRRQGVHMENVCRGRNWGAHGYLTKPMIYLEFLKRLPKVSKLGGLVHVILMDSDTFWASASLRSIWNKYDCARGDKHVVLSTEMSCWVGRYCTVDDVKKWYKDPESTPSYSPFVNSGIVMGTIDKVSKMLEHVIVNNKSYYITYIKNKFDDQYAIADYAIRVAPEDVALDYHQQLLASFTMHAAGDEADDGWPFRCKTRFGNISMSCPNLTPRMNRLGHFRTNSSSCLVHRGLWPGMPMQEEAESLATDPVIWHGNGGGKHIGIGHGFSSMKCFAQRYYNMTIDQYQHAHGYG